MDRKKINKEEYSEENKEGRALFFVPFCKRSSKKVTGKFFQGNRNRN